MAEDATTHLVSNVSAERRSSAFHPPTVRAENAHENTVTPSVEVMKMMAKTEAPERTMLTTSVTRLPTRSTDHTEAMLPGSAATATMVETRYLQPAGPHVHAEGERGCNGPIAVNGGYMAWPNRHHTS